MTRLDELREILADRLSDLEMARWRRSQAGHGAYVDELDYEVDRAERRLDWFWTDYGEELWQLQIIEAFRNIPVPEMITRRVILPREVKA